MKDFFKIIAECPRCEVCRCTANEALNIEEIIERAHPVMLKALKNALAYMENKPGFGENSDEVRQAIKTGELGPLRIATGHKSNERKEK